MFTVLGLFVCVFGLCVGLGLFWFAFNLVYGLIGCSLLFVCLAVTSRHYAAMGLCFLGLLCCLGLGFRHFCFGLRAVVLVALVVLFGLICCFRFRVVFP